MISNVASAAFEPTSVFQVDYLLVNFGSVIFLLLICFNKVMAGFTLILCAEIWNSHSLIFFPICFWKFSHLELEQPRYWPFVDIWFKGLCRGCWRYAEGGCCCKQRNWVARSKFSSELYTRIKESVYFDPLQHRKVLSHIYITSFPFFLFHIDLLQPFPFEPVLASNFLIFFPFHYHFNSLATAGYGTALGVIRAVHAEGILLRAYCTETRPFNQVSICHLNHSWFSLAACIGFADSKSEITNFVGMVLDNMWCYFIRVWYKKCMEVLSVKLSQLMTKIAENNDTHVTGFLYFVQLSSSRFLSMKISKLLFLSSVTILLLYPDFYCTYFFNGK